MKINMLLWNHYQPMLMVFTLFFVKTFLSVLTLYQTESETLLNEYPLYIAFEEERAIDLGGVSRDMFTAFFDEAYNKLV